MKNIVLVAVLFAVASLASAQQNIYCYPSSVASSNTLYISFDTSAYKYSLPDLNLKTSRTYNQHLCAPATLNGNVVTFAASQSNTNSTDLRTSDLTIAAQRNSGAPFPPSTNQLCFSYSGSDYCFYHDNGANKTYVQRKNGNTVLEFVQLPIPDTTAYYFYFDLDIQGRLQLATYTGFYRGSTILQYYAFATGPLRIVRGPIALPNTAGSGCPVEPAGCAVPVLLSNTFSVRNDIVSYLWSINNNNDYQVNIVTYDARCNLFKTVRLGSSLPVAERCLTSTTQGPTTTTRRPTTTTRSPTTTTQKPTRNCWTCGPGYIHWYDIPGYPEPADKCACVLKPSTSTTRGPTSTTQGPTRNCWTCGPGYIHWYDIPGYPEPADKCACVLRPSTTTTKGPTTTRSPTTTTQGPTRNCWTCGPGYIHWYDIPGYPEPADKCACVLRPSTSTTRGPTSTTQGPTRNCWTCLPGYVHWYDIPGYPEPADKCACVLKPSTSTTRGPTSTTQGPTRNCWTCLPGYVHWYDIPGYPEPADKCACVLRPSTSTTKGPTSTTQGPTRNCWTCLPGYVHWYDIPGYPEPADKCACVLRSSTGAPSRNCWTCLPGYVHWYDIPGYPEPADKCACVLRSSTGAPSRNCWTCPAGYIHWYDIPGYPEPADKCACVLRRSRGLASRVQQE